MGVFISGLLAGLSVGIYCIGICLPVFIPYLLSEERSAKSSFRAVLEFSLGRLLGYLVFGGIIGFLGEKVQSGLIHNLSSLATALMALVMIFYSLGLMRWPKVCGTLIPELGREKSRPRKRGRLLGFFQSLPLGNRSAPKNSSSGEFSARKPAGRSRIPITLGFLTGVNVCPPFLASLSYVFNLRSAFSGILYFLGFFSGTSLYIVPATLLGFFTHKPILQKIARLSGVLVGIYFLISAFNLL